MGQIKKYTFIDLFAGAGGLSEGFISEDFTPISHVEKDISACLTLQTRMAFHHLKETDSSSIYTSYLKKAISKEVLVEKIPAPILESVICAEMSNESFDSICQKINTDSVDIIIGGPPCQAYSIVGRARQRDDEKKANDPRRFLYKIYLKFLQQYKPKIFVFENVPGILSLKDADGRKFIDKMKIEFSEIGYYFDYQLLDTADFGVMQRRQRVIIVGWQQDLNLSYPDFNNEKIGEKIFLVGRDLLGDLPKLQAGEQWKSFDYAAPPTHYLEQSNIRNNKDVLTWHLVRPTNPNDKEIYKRTVKTWMEDGKRLKYNDLPDSLKTHKNQASFLNRFCAVEGNQPFTHTMVAHIAQDGHYYIHPDIEQNRSISVREAARIQSFPDNYYFEGSRTAAFQQIGNAVPPLFARVIAKKIKELLCQITN